MTTERIKVLMAKPGIDGHWRGMIAVSTALRDAGMEVIYGGNMMPGEIAKVAIQEDVDVVGLSILSGNIRYLVRATVDELKNAGKTDVMVVIGGIVYDPEIPELEKAGVHKIFHPGTPFPDIVNFIQENAKKLSLSA